MCINDLRLGKLVIPRFQAVTVGAAATLTLAADPQRIGLIVACDQTSVSVNASIQIDGVAVDFLSTSHPVASLSLLTIGQGIVRVPGVQNFTLATLAIGITELTLPAEYLATMLEHWRTEYGMALSL